MGRDPLDPQDLTQDKWHHPQVTRRSTRQSAPAKILASRAEDMKPGGRRTDPYLPKLADVSGYDPRLQDAIRAFAAADRRAQAQKKRGRKP